MSVQLRTGVFAFSALLTAVPAFAEAPAMREFTAYTDGAGSMIYHVIFEKPEKLLLPAWGKRDPHAMARLPRLVHDDRRSTGLSLLPVTNLAFNAEPLEFIGRWPKDRDATSFRLLYPVCTNMKGGNSVDPFENCEWVEEPITLKRDNAKHVYPNTGDPMKPLKANELEQLWAAALQAEFARLAAQAPDFPFYQFAQVALSRRHGIPIPAALANAADRQPTYREIFEVFTGSASITESLQTRRLIRPVTEKQPRTVEVGHIRTIELAQHPWDKMMAGRKPDPEPLAEFAQADNYYARFRSMDKVLALGDWIDLWGGNLLSAYEYRTRHHGLRERYERQLCLPLERFTKALPKDLVDELAVTGSDISIREGTDITVIFHTRDAKQFVQLLEPFIAEAREKYRGKWRSAREDYHEVIIDSFTTPDREVSLYRATLDGYVLLSNSPVGLRRALDARQGRGHPLSRSLDFQYMRTCFRADNAEEDGFAFLSDSFIRRLVGPAQVIKQSRRTEALAALRTATDARMLNGWLGDNRDNGGLGNLVPEFLRDSDLEVPDGKPVSWDVKDKLARSDVYGTLGFATPLIELPLDKATKAEADAYESFRQSYLRLWTRFSDPVGMRFRQNGARTRMEAYILPVIRSQQYDWLRQMSDGGTVTFDPSKMGPSTVLMFLANMNLGGFFGNNGNSSIFIRLDDSPLLKDVVRELIRAEREGRDIYEIGPTGLRKLVQLPLVLGLEGEIVKQIKPFLPLLKDYLKVEDEGTEVYRGITINGRKLSDPVVTRELNGPNEKDVFCPRFCYAEIGEGLYFSFRKDLIKQLIDRHLDGKNDKSNEGTRSNALFVARPQAAPDAREAINSYLEWQTHRRALPANAVWHALHRCGVIPDGAGEVDEVKAARHYLGYLPVSPDGSAYLYDRRWDEVFNRRHGSYRQPQLRPTLATNSPLRALLEEFQTVRIDLRFREDGIHTTLTWQHR